MSAATDVLIIGGGAAGLNIAYQLSTRFPKVTFRIVEALEALASLNTARSAAGVRDTFTHPWNRRATRFSIDFFREAEREEGIGLRLVGYQWLLTAWQWRRLGPYFRQMAAEGLDVERISLPELLRRFPDLVLRHEEGDRRLFLQAIRSSSVTHLVPHAGLADVYVGLLGRNCGYLEPSRLMDYLARRVRRAAGGSIHLGERVVAIREEGKGGYRVEVQQGETRRRYLARKVVVAGGISSNPLLGEGCIEAAPLMRQLFYMDVPGDPFRHLPFLIFPSGVHIRPATEGMMVAYPHRQEPGLLNSPIPSLYSQYLHLYLCAYLPGWERARPNSRVFGHYHMTPDHNPILFLDRKGLGSYCGDSGSGIMKGPYLGYLMAHLLAGRAHHLPAEDRRAISLLHPDRFKKDRRGRYLLRGRWIEEHAVL